MTPVDDIIIGFLIGLPTGGILGLWAQRHGVVRPGR
jgi:hypothetical protein